MVVFGIAMLDAAARRTRKPVLAFGKRNLSATSSATGEKKTSFGTWGGTSLLFGNVKLGMKMN
jgi:hypothetical protein